MISLVNNYLKASFHELGAELSSICNHTGREYIWQADKSVWPRHSPVLFPIVGRLQQNSYFYKGKKYELPQHGFARDRVFKVLSYEKNKIVFSLDADKDSYVVYPFNFELQISYLLQENILSVSYNVIYKEKETLYFSLGAHPGFNCPLADGEVYEDYFLKFEKPETLSLHLLNGGYISGEQKPFLENESSIPLSYNLFANDALIVEGFQSEYISLYHRIRGEQWRFHLKGYPYLGIWSKPGPFVCIEPWHGIADHVSHDGKLESKTGIRTLAPQGSFECSWAIEFTDL